MRASVETKVAAHQIARGRIDTGKPVWDRKFNVADIFQDEDMAVVDKVTEIARRIRSAPFFDEDETELVEIVEEFDYLVEGASTMTEGELADEFDEWWGSFYDWCDLVGRVWVETF